MDAKVDAKLGQRAVPAIKSAMVPILTRIFNVLDSDGSGAFEKAEYNSFMQVIMDQKKLPFLVRDVLVSILDLNKDGKLQSNELNAITETLATLLADAIHSLID